jgi:hypothetical protein
VTPTRVLLFYPYNPVPPVAGGHHRFFQLVSALQDLGCSLSLVSSSHTTDRPWGPESVEYLRQRGLRAVEIHHPTRKEALLLRAARLAHRLLNRVRHHPVSPTAFAVAARNLCCPSLCRHFAGALDRISPDLVLMSYALFDRLLPPGPQVVRVIDSIDLVSLRAQMLHALAPHFSGPAPRPEAVPDHALREEFFDALGLAPFPEEYRTYDRYDHTLAISQKEATLIGRHTARTRVSWVPMTQDVSRETNCFAGPALFAASASPFNVQGYYYFVKRVLPLVRRSAGDFTLRLTGTCCDAVRPAEGVEPCGLVADLRPLYAAARFVVCPVFGGTGQQVKVVEAMAQGLPVVALRAAAEASPLRHRVNGLVVSNADEFAAAVVQLWNDPPLCRRLGDAARETVAEHYSASRVRSTLSQILGSRGGRPA